MNKHAYLIIAHNDFYILEKLLMLLDDERNDIYSQVQCELNLLEEASKKLWILSFNIWSRFANKNSKLYTDYFNKRDV